MSNGPIEFVHLPQCMATSSATLTFPVMRFLFHEETHKLLPSYASLATMSAPLPSYCVAPASDCVPLCPVFSFFATAFRPALSTCVCDFIDRSQATDFASAFHLCPVFLTRPFTCRPTLCVKSAQILETAFESKPWQHGVQFSSLENVFSSQSSSVVFLSSLQQLPLVIP